MCPSPLQVHKPEKLVYAVDLIDIMKHGYQIHGFTQAAHPKTARIGASSGNVVYCASHREARSIQSSSPIVHRYYPHMDVIAIPEPGPEGVIALSEATRDRVGVRVGDIVRVEYDDSAVQRRVVPVPKQGLKVEKSGALEHPLCFLSPLDWKFLGLRRPSSHEEARANRVMVSVANDWIETP